MNSFLKIFADNDDSSSIDSAFSEFENEELVLQEIVDKREEASMVCIKKPNIPNFFSVVYANKSLYDLFEIGEEDIIGKSYDFFWTEADLDSCAEDQLEYGRLIKAVRDNHECSVILSAACKIIKNEHSGLHISFTPHVSTKSQRNYGIFSFIKVNHLDEDGGRYPMTSKSSNILLQSLERSLNSEKLLREIANMVLAESSIDSLIGMVAKLLCENLKCDRCLIQRFPQKTLTGSSFGSIAEHCFGEAKKMTESSDSSSDKLIRYIEFQKDFFKKFGNQDKKFDLLNVKDLAEDKTFDPIRDIVNEFEIFSQLSSNIILRDDVIGAIHLHVSAKRAWIDEEIKIIEMVTKQLSIAIDRANSVEKAANANQTLIERTQQLEEALRHEQEMRKIQNEFIALVSHEFKTPLQVIDSTREVIFRKVKNLGIDDDSISQSLERIKSGIHRMNSLINSTLNLAQIESGGGKIKAEMSEFNLNSLLHEVIDKNFALAQQKKIEIYCRIDELPKSYLSDAKMLDHIFTNIISNAIKYSKSGSDIKIVAKETSKNYAIRVVDTGIGIPKDELQNIGQKFFRASNSRTVSGTGIGLYLTRFFTEMIGGVFAIDSQKDIGTSVTVILPKSPKI